MPGGFLCLLLFWEDFSVGGFCVLIIAGEFCPVRQFTGII